MRTCIGPWQTVAQQGHKNVPNIVSLSYCLEQLYSCIFNSYVKACLNIWWRRMYGLKLFLFTSCWRVYRCVRDDWQLCLVHVNSLITHLQLQKMLIIYQSAHAAITFQLLEMISITILNQTILNIRSRYKFSRKNTSNFTDLHNENNQIWKFRVNRIVSVIGTLVNVYYIS